VVGSRISAIELPEAARLYAHGGDDEPMTIPLPTTTVAAGDRLALVIDPEAVDEVRSRLLGEQ